MTADELNRRLAEALGIPRTCGKLGCDGSCSSARKKFNPARRVDDLRAYVLPEIKRRGKVADMLMRLETMYKDPPVEVGLVWWQRWQWFLLTAAPAVLAEAALEALEEEG